MPNKKLDVNIESKKYKDRVEHLRKAIDDQENALKSLEKIVRENSNTYVRSLVDSVRQA